MPILRSHGWPGVLYLEVKNLSIAGGITKAQVAAPDAGGLGDRRAHDHAPRSDDARRRRRCATRSPGRAPRCGATSTCPVDNFAYPAGAPRRGRRGRRARGGLPHGRHDRARPCAHGRQTPTTLPRVRVNGTDSAAAVLQAVRIRAVSAINDITIRAPTRGNRKLEKLLAAVNADDQIKAWWHAAGVNAERLDMSDHSWVHIQIVTNIALRLARLLFRRGIEPSVVKDHGMTERDAEVVIAAGSLLHCLGMAIHRTDHETYSLFLAADKLPGAARRRLRRARAHADRRRGDARHHLPPHEGQAASPSRARSCASRTRSTWHRAARACRSRPVTPTSTRCRPTRSRTSRSPRAATRPCASRSRCPTRQGSSRSTRGSARSCAEPCLEQHIEVIARIDAEHEKRLVPVFRL